MRKLIICATVGLGFILGVGGGYVMALLVAASNSPFVGNRDLKTRQFNGVVEDFAKLGGYESVAANCNGTSDTRAAFEIERRVISDLRERKPADASLLNIAEARLLARMKESHADDQTGTDQRIESLLREAGWTDPSAAHLRELIRELDHDQCRQVVLRIAQ